MLKSLDCLVVSAFTGDYLAHTLPLNKSLYNRQLVVSHKDDAETRRICDYQNVEVFLTDSFYAGGAKFNKGAAIQEALEHLDKTGSFRGWMIHQDVDIVLPPLARHILESISLVEQNLYGVDRVMCPSPEHWVRYMQNPVPQHVQAYCHVGPWPVGTRVFKLDQNGYVPLGFFQLFHRNAQALTKQPWYPTDWDSAATSDLFFAYKWPRSHRHLLPEFVAMHLATEDITYGPMGQNWEGRKTRRFEVRDPYTVQGGVRPAPVPDAKKNP